MSDYTKVVTSWAKEPFITHDDYRKCGLCWREQIKAEVSQELLEKEIPIGVEEFRSVLDETKRRWRETDLYKRVYYMMSNLGLTLEDVDNELRDEGIEI